MATTPSRGVSIKMFLADGTPEGLRLIEKSNWTGMGLMCSRTRYLEVRGRDEFTRPGVYLLFGPPSSDSSQQTIYIGQADVARERLDHHVRNKEFWTHVILFSSKDTNLNKAHVQYLESRLIDIAAKARRAAMENGNAPRVPALSEADRADAETFLDEMLLLYPILGITAFETVEQVEKRGGTILHLTARQTEARAIETDEGFVVLKGSRGRIDARNSIAPYLVTLRQQLLDSGVLEATGDNLLFTQDWIFESPSTAAGVVVGGDTNGREAWKNEQGQMLKEIQETAIKAIPG